jgi:hypothetical protein
LSVGDHVIHFRGVSDFEVDITYLITVTPGKK